MQVGHGGTLDPLATGVLPIAVGEATKLCGRMLDASKTYAFTVAFGAETDTLDLEGAVIGEARLGLRARRSTPFCAFTGPIAQVPPAYSALKVDGQRAYDLARAGHEVVLASRNVTIHALRVLERRMDDARWKAPRWKPMCPRHLYPQPRARHRWRWARAGMSPCCAA
jgi:tRNA pseudouridine55 synthase